VSFVKKNGAPEPFPGLACGVSRLSMLTQHRETDQKEGRKVGIEERGKTRKSVHYPGRKNVGVNIMKKTSRFTFSMKFLHVTTEDFSSYENSISRLTNKKNLTFKKKIRIFIQKSLTWSCCC